MSTHRNRGHSWLQGMLLFCALLLGARSAQAARALSVSTTVSTSGACPGQEVVNVAVGTPITWCYVVLNTGTDRINLPTVSDDVYGSVPGQLIGVGQGFTYSRPDVAHADLTLTATAHGTDAVTGVAVTSSPDPAAVN